MKSGEEETVLNQITANIAGDTVAVVDAITIGQIIHIVIDQYQVPSQENTDAKDSEAHLKIATIDDKISNIRIRETIENWSRKMSKTNLRLK